jgi:CzcA family heavy metal efflux pump
VNHLIQWCVRNRLLVVAAAVLLLLVGLYVGRSMPVDVFPDLTAPTVTVLTEAHGLAPEEVETLVTYPIETSVNGATGVRRVRSASGVGISIVWVEFDWGTDIYTARQIVNEKLQLIGAQLPPDIQPPSMAPISSVMGEILFLSVSRDNPSANPQTRQEEAMEARTFADHILRKRLLSVAGVSQVVPIGGAVKQIQVLLRPESMAGVGVTFDQVAQAVRHGNGNASGGFYTENGQEILLRAVGRAADAADIADTVVTTRNGQPILVRHVADVRVGPKIKRGEGSANGKPAVVLAVMKQPDANTLELTETIDAMLDEIEPGMPSGLTLDRHIFRQSDFISLAIDNVTGALRDGAILVALILVLFLGNFRSSVISLTAIPLSLVVAILALHLMGLTLNTMTLGGLTIAIGAVVDDAIIGVENIFRRLKENRALPEPERKDEYGVITSAAAEILNSIVFATLIIILVFVPLFFLSGLEGRMLAPLGIAYVISIAASLVVALTVTPAMCAYLFPGSTTLDDTESRVMRWLKAGYAPMLRAAQRRPSLVLGSVAVVFVATMLIVPFLGRSFLPEFNEGTLTVNMVTLPGTSLEASDRLGRRVEEALLSVPEVVATSRRTGRAELDEHAQDVNAAEIDVRLDLSSGRHKEEVLADARGALAQIGGAVFNVGQPLSHRIDHMLSGSRSAIALKVFGDDLETMRGLAEQIEAIGKSTPGAVDVSIEQQVDIPELEIRADRMALARYGLGAGALAESVERAFTGETVGQLLEGQRTIDVVVRMNDSVRESLASLRATPIDTPSGARIPLGMLATLSRDTSPNTIVREGVIRKMVVQANVSSSDLSGVVDALRERITAEVEFPEGYFVVYGGQFESAEEATRTISVLTVGVVVGMFLLLTVAFQSTRNAGLMLVNLPLSLIGGVLAVAMTSGVVSIASLVGFVTLFGIATRNGILMVNHYDHLVREEGCSMSEAVYQGSMERLAPVVMTALTAGLALVPLVLAGNEAGNEIQAPMGVVLVGGLLSSTVLTMFVVPVLFERFGRVGES